MSVLEHLGELRRRLFISLLAVLVGAVVAFVFSKEIISFLVTFYRDATGGKRHALIFTGPLDGFVTRLKIATYGGIVLALPVWLYQLWRFITPALDRREKRYAFPFVAVVTRPVRARRLRRLPHLDRSAVVPVRRRRLGAATAADG